MVTCASGQLGHASGQPIPEAASTISSTTRQPTDINEPELRHLTRTLSLGHMHSKPSTIIVVSLCGCFRRTVDDALRVGGARDAPQDNPIAARSNERSHIDVGVCFNNNGGLSFVLLPPQLEFVRSGRSMLEKASLRLPSSSK